MVKRQMSTYRGAPTTRRRLADLLGVTGPMSVPQIGTGLGGDVKPGTIVATLTRMLRDGEVVRFRRRWSLAERAD